MQGANTIKHSWNRAALMLDGTKVCILLYIAHSCSTVWQCSNGCTCRALCKDMTARSASLEASPSCRVLTCSSSRCHAGSTAGGTGRPYSFTSLILPLWYCGFFICMTNDLFNRDISCCGQAGIEFCLWHGHATGRLGKADT